uniref:Calcium/calmodulin dependent protein kinase II n=1 Tax=Euglena gracilis TaxID=3039 RepID=B5AEK8_EUGGR|nr:calcium/calmodulin dependent protein kinase II [Euglena gracilis]
MAASLQDPAAREILTLTQHLLDVIAAGDYARYTELSASDVTSFEPEACGHLVEGLPFHKHYFDLFKQQASVYQGNQIICSPHIRFCGPDVAIISYVRVQQNGYTTRRSEETRVWHRQEGTWRQVHFHRSSPQNAFPAP